MSPWDIKTGYHYIVESRGRASILVARSTAIGIGLVTIRPHTNRRMGERLVSVDDFVELVPMTTYG